MSTTAIARPASSLVRIGIIAAFATGAALLVKVAVILATANTAPELLTSVLYVIGVFGPLLAAAGIASLVGGGWLRRIGVYLGVVAAHVFYVTMLSDPIGELAKVVSDAEYVADEAPLAVLGLLWVIAGVLLRRRALQRAV